MQLETEMDELLGSIRTYTKDSDLSLIRRAYEFASQAHWGQKRKSGDPSIKHCIEVAKILAGLHVDPTTIAAALLHDTLEDTDVTYQHIEREFGQEIAMLVDGVTKIGGLRFQSREAEQAENFRKMFLSMAKDIRVILIKFADRLHNMRTLQYLEPKQRRRIARETRDIYAPLAHRFGIARIKWELEDLSLKFLAPRCYRNIEEKVRLSRQQRESYIEEIKTPIQKALMRAGIKAKIIGRPKNFYSIYGKMKSRGKPFEQIYDLFAIRIIVDSIEECYHTLGLVHAMFTPVADRFKDFIATPKSNMYQSLHTTVIGPRRQMVEVQIRTKKMDQIAEEGIAAHWVYKEGRQKLNDLDKKMFWLRHLLDWQRDTVSYSDFMKELKETLFQDEIFVFTPKGDLKQLPKGSTPIDFAFAVHTDVGVHCWGAKVNGRMASLDSPLKNGDVVEIITSANQVPHRDWLNVVKTSKARSRIRRWLRAEEYVHSVRLGRELMEQELKKRAARLTEEELLNLALSMGITDVEHLFAAIGSGKASLSRVVKKLFPQPQRRLSLPTIFKRVKPETTGVTIQGYDNMMIRFAKCCQPVPGDSIVGFITRGRGVSIHRVECPNVPNLMKDNDRILAVRWDSNKGQIFTTQVLVSAHDRKNLLNEITGSISAAEVNIRSVTAEAKGEMASIRFSLEVQNVQHLTRVMKNIQKIKGVTAVKRVTQVTAE
ncbi:MAG: (p)ppGpp synthetase [Candidatus Latescibacterota bacterium]|nr:MAG: (p)ppGpp synthetase [Candidatus Latescibacterota bacterium]RKY72870.1 MAG: (p)ppGpp synthetase [Candidatus Latescibacterota bacterium]